MLLNPFARRGDRHALAVGMAGIKMGDRVAWVGAPDGARLAAVAAKVGLSGRAVAFVGDDAAAGRARRGGEQAGVLIELEPGPPTSLRTESGAFDVAIVDDTGGALASLSDEDRRTALGELLRIVRPSGRAMIIGGGAPAGLGGLLGRAPEMPSYDRVKALQTAGFIAVRILAEREGLIFVEGVKPRSPERDNGITG